MKASLPDAPHPSVPAIPVPSLTIRGALNECNIMQRGDYMDAIQRRGKPSALPSNLHPGKDRRLPSEHLDRLATPDAEQDLLFRTHLAVTAGVLVG